MSDYTSFRTDDIDGVVKVGSYVVEQVVNIKDNIIITKKVVLKLPRVPKIKRKRKAG